jgi:hypothetical protein
MQNQPSELILYSHDKINASELANTCVHGLLDLLWFPDVDSSHAQNRTSWTNRLDLFGHAFCLFMVPSHYASVGPKRYQSSYLAGADGTRTASAKDDFLICPRKIWSVSDLGMLIFVAPPLA